MSKFTAFVLLVALRVFYQPSIAQTELSAFTTISSFKIKEEKNNETNLPALGLSKTNPVVTARIIQFNGSYENNKMILNWVVSGNESADQFEVERSLDGKTFIMAALVFGTDKPNEDKYQFYEKAANKKVSYRIKLINKNKQAEYSVVIEINRMTPITARQKLWYAERTGIRSFIAQRVFA